MSDSHLDENGFVILEPDTEPAPDLYAIVDCGLCDDEGYRGARVCDHVDRTETARRGSALVRAELDRIRQRKADAAR